MNNEKEVNLKELFYIVCKQWRYILLIPIISSVILLITKIKNIMSGTQDLNIMESVFNPILIGYALGVLVVALFCTCRFAMSDRIKSPTELWNYSNINLIGVIPRPQAKRDRKFDFFVKRVLGKIKIKRNDCDELVKCIVSEIKAEINIKAKGKSRIALVSSDSLETASEFESLIRDKLPDEISLCLSGDIRLSSEGIKSAAEADYVILVERQFKSRYSDLEEICRRLKIWKKEILGIVLLDVDAV